LPGEVSGLPDVAARLSTQHTVARSLVHRDAVSEVFVTDALGFARGFVVAAQLPSAHSYYTDHTVASRMPDPLLLLECARQAETMGVHEFLGAPRQTAFLLQRWTMDLAPLQDADLSARQPHTVVIVDEPEVRGAGGKLRGAEHRMRLYLRSQHIGTITMTVAYLPSATYRAVRAKGRGSIPPMSDGITTGDKWGVCRPSQVGRHNPDNVVLRFPQALGGQLVALLCPLIDHPSLFDHPQDHIPGMALMEAARQAALLASSEFGFGPPEYTALVSLDADFASYTELDRVTTVRTGQPQVTGPDSCEVSVAFHQADVITATATIGLRRVPIQKV